MCKLAKFVSMQNPIDHGTPGLLHPLLIAKHYWNVVSLDFIEGLPVSGSANRILVVVDTFSKYAHFLPISHPYTVQRIAQLYIDNIYKLWHARSLGL